jgi:hypothetical protein
MEIPFALIHVESGMTMENYGVINNSGTLLIDGWFTNEPDGFVNSEPDALIYITEHGTLWNKGTVSSQGTLKNEGTLINDGTIDIGDHGVFDNSGVLNNSGTINGYTDGTDNGSDNASDDVDPKGSTDITKGLVTLTGADGQLLAQKRMVSQDDGTWAINVPVSTDLSNVALSFSLPDAETGILPENGSSHDFSGGEADPLTYSVISANGKAHENYAVWLREPKESVLLDTDPSKWWFSEYANADGSVLFVVEAPLSGDAGSIDESQLDVSLGEERNYSDKRVMLLGSPMLMVRGTAYSRRELESLNIFRVEWVLEGGDGSEYFQDIIPPMTYDVLSTRTAGVVSVSGGDDGGGCAVGFWPLMAILLAAGAAVARRRE